MSVKSFAETRAESYMGVRGRDGSDLDVRAEREERDQLVAAALVDHRVVRGRVVEDARKLGGQPRVAGLDVRVDVRAGRMLIVQCKPARESRTAFSTPLSR